MYPYSRSVSPAAKSHLEAQLSFFNGISKSLFRSVQQFSDLNLQFAQGLLEESTIASQNLLTVDRTEDLFQVAAASGQPVAEQLRIYQQQASRLAADAQVDLASVAEKHISETSRTAKVLAEEVARTASEETEKNVRKQQDAIQRISEPFQAFQNGSSRDQRGAQGQTQSRAGESLQSAAHQGSQQSGSAESGAAHTAGSAAQGKTSGSTGRKE
ncbi:phasin family protein [Janthinobacterium sp.]|uniref:phasin family protein n=1 Tax=Janthinobacterium sp. TaxID=1871054 RepID=UPI002618B32E|nr:phasin family protein [Janthinobacterium sp.]